MIKNDIEKFFFSKTLIKANKNIALQVNYVSRRKK